MLAGVEPQRLVVDDETRPLYLPAGTVRSRIRKKRNGEIAVNWFADYYDQHRSVIARVLRQSGRPTIGWTIPASR
jgi:hypothetical protein